MAQIGTKDSGNVVLENGKGGLGRHIYEKTKIKDLLLFVDCFLTSGGSSKGAALCRPSLLLFPPSVKYGATGHNIMHSY